MSHYPDIKPFSQVEDLSFYDTTVILIYLDVDLMSVIFTINFCWFVNTSEKSYITKNANFLLKYFVQTRLPFKCLEILNPSDVVNNPV